MNVRRDTNINGMYNLDHRIRLLWWLWRSNVKTQSEYTKEKRRSQLGWCVGWSCPAGCVTISLPWDEAMQRITLHHGSIWNRASNQRRTLHSTMNDRISELKVNRELMTVTTSYFEKDWLVISDDRSIKAHLEIASTHLRWLENICFGEINLQSVLQNDGRNVIMIDRSHNGNHVCALLQIEIDSSQYERCSAKQVYSRPVERTRKCSVQKQFVTSRVLLLTRSKFIFFLSLVSFLLDEWCW